MTGAPAEERRPVARVGCRHLGGLKLRLFKPGPESGSQVADGPVVVVRGPNRHVAAGAGSPTGSEGAEQFGITDVDAEFWNAWYGQNAGHNAHVDSGFIFLVDDEGRPVENPT